MCSLRQLYGSSSFLYRSASLWHFLLNVCMCLYRMHVQCIRYCLIIFSCLQSFLHFILFAYLLLEVQVPRTIWSACIWVMGTFHGLTTYVKHLEIHFISSRCLKYRVAQKVSHYYESSLNRIKTRHYKARFHQFRLQNEQQNMISLY